MRWPIRNQILVPLLIIQTVTIFAVAAASAWVGVQQAEQDIETRLENVMATLDAATYPLTQTILDQLKRLSGAEFVVYNTLGTLEAANLRGFESAELNAIQTQFAVNENDIIDDALIVDIGGKRYFSAYLKLDSGVNAGTVFVFLPESRWIFARSQAMYPPLFIGAICLGLTIIASIFIAGHFSRRIQDVQQHVARIADGDFTPSPSTRRQDELHDLSTGINQMAATLEQLLRKIRDQERSRLMTQMVGGLAHQLRNALTGARTSIQLHQRHCPIQDDQALKIALRQCTLTEAQIKALLRLAKGETSHPVRSDVSQVLDETTALIRPICEHQKIGFDYQRDDATIVIADADALRGALINLMMNATEAAGPGGRVEVTARHLREDDLMIEISDDGPGIAPELGEEIFDPFYTTKPEGVGLGLALAKKAADECNGTLSYLRKADRSVFRFHISKPARTQMVDQHTETG